MFMLDLLPSVLILVLVSVMIGVLRKKRPRNCPPGPSGLPLVGYALFLGTKPFETYMRLKEKYGSVVSVPIGTSNWIILNSFECINEAFVKQSEIFSGRPAIFAKGTGGHGVATIDHGIVWKDFRRFGSKTLRGFGVGKKSMEENIISEIPFVLDFLMTENKDSLKTKLNLAVSNIICGVVFGSRFLYDDKKFRKLNGVVTKTLSNNATAKLNGLAVLAPILRYFPPFKGAVEFITKEQKDLTKIMKEIVDEHKATYNENEMRDFIDAFLKESKEGGERSPFSEEQHLLQYIRDLFTGGSGTTSSTLHWSILAFCHYPECQEKIANEIHDVIGEDGHPSMGYREQMPYTCAFIQEIMRHRVLFPLGVPRKCNRETVLNGYTIPSDSTVIANLWAVHFDPDLFENPRKFCPERFIDSEGKFVSSSHVIPFSLGPRHCLAEQLAKMEVFLFLTGIVQKLCVVTDETHNLPPLEEGGFNMFTYEGPDFQVTFKHR